MAVHASHSALPYPIKGARYSMLVPGLDADGDPTAATTPDTEISKDNSTVADCTEEVSATTSMDGMALMTFTGAEMDCSCAGINFKCASGPKATLATLYPRVLASVGTGTLSAGSASGGTLGTLLAYDVTGCFIKTTGGTGGGGTGGANNQARKMITYNTSTGAFTVVPDWETTPDATTTYDVLLPEGVTLGMLKTLNPTTAGRTLTVESDGMAHADVKEWLAAAVTLSTGNKPDVNVDEISDDATAPANLELDYDGTGYNKSNSTIGTATNVTSTVNANVTQISGDSVAADNLEAAADGAGYNLGGGAIVAASVTGNVAGTVASVVGNVGGNVTGSVGSLATQAKADVNAEVDSALNTAIPGSPTADSINERVRAMDIAIGEIYTTTASVYGATVVDGAPTSTVFVTNISGYPDNALNDQIVVFETGTLDRQARPILLYEQNGSNGRITVDEAFTGAPANGDTFSIRIDHVHPVAQISDGVWDEALSGHSTAGTGGKLVTDANTAVTSGTHGNAALKTLIDTVDDLLDTEVAAIKTKTDQLVFTNTNKVDAAILAANDIATAVAQKIAHILIRRTMTNVEASSDGDTLDLSSLYGLIQMLQEASVSGTTLTVKKVDGSTTLGTKTITTNASADPVTGIA